MERPVVSLSLCNGNSVAAGGWVGIVISNRSPLKMCVRNRWSLIPISHRFASQLNILHKSDNTVHWVFACRRCDRPDNVQFEKSWEKYVTSFDAGLSSPPRNSTILDANIIMHVQFMGGNLFRTHLSVNISICSMVNHFLPIGISIIAYLWISAYIKGALQTLIPSSHSPWEMVCRTNS